jgi:hypothetical protein
MPFEITPISRLEFVDISTGEIVQTNENGVVPLNWIESSRIQASQLKEIQVRSGLLTSYERVCRIFLHPASVTVQ